MAQLASKTAPESTKMPHDCLEAAHEAAKMAQVRPTEPREAGAMLADIRAPGDGGALRKKQHPGQETTGALLHTTSCRRHGGGYIHICVCMHVCMYICIYVHV